MEELLQKIEEWNETSEFSRAIQAIEAIPEEERSYPLTLWLGRLTSNLAVLGDQDSRIKKDEEPNWDLLRKALEILESVQEEGKEDPVWYSRIAYVLSMKNDVRQALEYAQRWVELAPEDPDARELLENCQKYLRDVGKGKKKY